MKHRHLALATALLASLTLSACSSDQASQGAPPATGTSAPPPFKDDTDVPLTKQLARGELTQAIPDAKDVVPGYYPGSLHKWPGAKADSCGPRDASPPAGWQQTGRGDYDYQGSTRSREIDLYICQFDDAAHAKTAYDQLQEKQETAPVQGPSPVGEESAFLAHSGQSGTVYAYSRSGNVVVRVRVEDAGADPTDAHDVLAATIKRLQQVQAGRRATATAGEIAEAERAKR
ncbi:hypothetical protein ACFW6F_26265 [Streptomyces sp. NPDC058746]|uniref:DUF7373 family lipoprotein n=1 Tax=Streptomyces sp. NPDC058746 TaxID=3346622 RepID=UPI0036C5F052